MPTETPILGRFALRGNTGTISAGKKGRDPGIFVGGIATGQSGASVTLSAFTGGIVNSGRLVVSGGAPGIFVGGIASGGFIPPTGVSVTAGESSKPVWHSAMTCTLPVQPPSRAASLIPGR